MTFEESCEEGAKQAKRQADEVAKQTEAEFRKAVAIEEACAAICDLCAFWKQKSNLT